MTIVIDASIAVKWFLQEENSELSRQLLAEYDDLVAPELILIEVISAITKAVRTQRITREEAEQHCQSWLKVVANGLITLIPDALHLEQATTLSLEQAHSFQDCLYLAAAQQGTAPLATQDDKLRQKATEIDVEVVNLGEV